MRRTEYFKRIEQVKSPLLLLDGFSRLVEMRTDDLLEPKEMYSEIALELESIGTTEATTRAEFIRQQVKGERGRDFFDKHRESWGIPIFLEDLIVIDDFRFGFLWRFRDHTTSWSEYFQARSWFYASIEAQTVRIWEFWSHDKGHDEIIYKEQGNYKEILARLTTIYQDYEALTSPVFLKEELEVFLEKYDETGGDFRKDVILKDYITRNPNWRSKNPVR